MIDTATALAMIDDGGTVIARTSRDVVRAAGTEATQYLQGQISQNAELLGVGETTWSFVLQPQGKVDAWFRLTRLADAAYMLDLEPGYGQQTIDRLSRFKLRTEVEFTLESVAMTAVRGAQAASHAKALAASHAKDLAASHAKALAASPAEDEASITEMDVAVPAGWSGDNSWDVLHLSGGGDGAASFDGQGASPASVEEAFLEWDRIRRGVPAMGAELNESTIPGATAVVAVSADFTKGCYVGQELVARVDSRGSNTPTKLVRLKATTSQTVAVGSRLFIGDAEIGELTSVASTGGQLAGLGYVKRSALAEASEHPLRATVEAEDGTSVDVVLQLIVHSV